MGSRLEAALLARIRWRHARPGAIRCGKMKKMLLMILILFVIPAALVVCIGLAYGWLHNATTPAH